LIKPNPSTGVARTIKVRGNSSSCCECCFSAFQVRVCCKDVQSIAYAVVDDSHPASVIRNTMQHVFPAQSWISSHLPC
jgi:hypothetical protein